MDFDASLYSSETSDGELIANKFNSLDLSGREMDVMQLKSMLARLAAADTLDPSAVDVDQASGGGDDDSAGQLQLPANWSSRVRQLQLSHNQLKCLPAGVLSSLNSLSSLVLKHNRLHDSALPKDLSSLRSVRELNLSDNCFTGIPDQILQLSNLVHLYMGANQIKHIPVTIHRLTRLRILYLGGNCLMYVPESLGQLTSLQVLALCDNRLKEVPSSISHLSHLRTLLLHANCLSTLPAALLRLRGLRQLSIRDNPLIRHFVRALQYEVPSLVELAARVVTMYRISYTDHNSTPLLPHTLIQYLLTAKQCVNKRCNGVYFDSRVEDVQFVDCCGMYHLPLVRYLCSSHCDNRHHHHHHRMRSVAEHSDESSSDSSASSGADQRAQEGLHIHRRRLRRVLLG